MTEPPPDRAPTDVETKESRKRTLAKLAAALRSTDEQPRLATAARIARELLPGDKDFGDPLSTAGDEPAHALGRRLTQLSAERPSVLGEMGLSALQVWESISGSPEEGKETEITILFTDLVDFSKWALEAGDTKAIELLRLVGTAIEPAVTEHDGVIVKRLGDGLMAAFSEPGDAIAAAVDAREAIREVELEGHQPRMRAGVHFGHPRSLGGDYLGVDVNIAARVTEAASGDEILISETARQRLAPAALERRGLRLKRRRRFRAKGAPSDLGVYVVTGAK